MTGREFSAGGADPTGHGLSADDVDLLADFVGGALDGTARYAEVAERVQRDPAWRRTHTLLVESTAAVTTDLRAWGAAAEPMPDAVVGRLTAVLAGASQIRGPRPGAVDPVRAATGDPDGSGPAAPRRLALVTSDGTGNAATRNAGAIRRPGRRRLRWAGPLVAAAAVVAVAGIGLSALPGIVADEPTATTGVRADADNFGAPAQAPDDDAARLPAGESTRGLADAPARRLVASGRDYEPRTLPGAAALAVTPGFNDGRGDGSAEGAAPRAPEQAGPAEGGDLAGRTPTAADGGLLSDLDVARVDPTLRALASPAALAACLAAVGGSHSRPLAIVELVDYAAFQAAPALVVVFTDIAGQRWVWAVGPDCGAPASGADSRYRANIG